jgi:hypothetical protein
MPVCPCQLCQVSCCSADGGTDPAALYIRVTSRSATAGDLRFEPSQQPAVLFSLSRWTVGKSGSKSRIQVRLCQAT